MDLTAVLHLHGIACCFTIVSRSSRRRPRQMRPVECTNDQRCRQWLLMCMHQPMASALSESIRAVAACGSLHHIFSVWTKGVCGHGVVQAPDAQAGAGARAGGLAAPGAPAGRAAALPGALPAQRRPHRRHPQPLQGASCTLTRLETYIAVRDTSDRVMVHFWAPYCPPLLLAAPGLKSIDMYGDVVLKPGIYCGLAACRL